MTNDKLHAPLQYQGVMISSTFSDLKEHRAALIKAVSASNLKDIAMENDAAKADLDVIDSSLQMVRHGAAYIGVISRKYGQMPECPRRNPGNISLTELEFNEAQKLGRPILLFIMGENHPLLEADVEIDVAKRAKLEAFRERAKRMRPDSPVHRVYTIFDSPEEFESKAIQAIAKLENYLNSKAAPSTKPQPEPEKSSPDAIPSPPVFYAEPPYIASHKFVGRERELITLDDWASPADPYSILLFEAIGGTGKSMITWEWVNNWATTIREDWAGRFWYSFYEHGADMSDFCRRAMAYVTQRPLSDFRRQRTIRLSKLLVTKLQARPWLFILDGLERVLVAYHRFDAAQLRDEAAGESDQIAHRDPCAAIRPEDDDLLRSLAAAAPSKLLITSRLIPRILLSPSSQPIPGVQHERLPGLRPTDAEALLRSCGVTGNSQEIQNYLKSHCDCHPLVTGVLAGLINNYLPDRGNFDAWVADPNQGGYLNLANLDLVQKRNHILRAAFESLPEKSRQLISTLALLSGAFDYQTLSALNPHQPPDPQELTETVLDLEQRGLLQYDTQSKRYDLHPVVRGVAAGGLKREEKEHYGQRVVDHFSQKAHNPYEKAETLEDVSDGLHLVRTLHQMGRFEEAFDVYRDDLANALDCNLEAHAEVLSLLRPFFPHGWSSLPTEVSDYAKGYLANDAGLALKAIGEREEALAAYGAAMFAALSQKGWSDVQIYLSNIHEALSAQGSLAKEERCVLLALNLADLRNDNEALFYARLDCFRQLIDVGKWKEAEDMWRRLDPMGRDWSREVYLPGEAEHYYALFRFWQGSLREEELARAEKLAKAGINRFTIRALHSLRGKWRLGQGQWSLAADSLHEAVRMAREVGHTDAASEAYLALAKFQLKQLPDANHEVEQLAQAKESAHLPLAELWLAIGDHNQARKHALEAYREAWADGEPYVYRYALNEACTLLQKLGVEVPDLRPYGLVKDEKLAWEDNLVEAIEKLRAEKAAKAKKRRPAKKSKK
jgi:hypothetical protein